MNKLLFFLFYFVCGRIVLASNGNSSDSAEKVFEFLNKAREKLILTKNPNIILVTGITGGGKSTLIHYVAGNYSKMIAIEPDGINSEYKIYDGLDEDLDNLDSSTVSRTLVPEMNVDEEQNVWYDCPGFADTRNETVEIATTFLIKSVIENAKSIKVVLVVNYESVTEGHDRQDFDRSLSRLTELIQNTTRFEDSVSIVITKTPSYYIRGKQVIEVSEDSVKKSTANFARDHRSVLQQKGSNEKKIQMIDALLKQSPNGDYTRISVFWRPMEAGPFDEIEKMIKGRQSIRDSILKHISYSNFDEDDFGFPLTAETKLEITNIAQHTIDGISTILKNVDSQLLSALEQRIQSAGDFHRRLKLLKRGQSIVHSIDDNEITLQQWIDRLKSLIRSFDITSINMGEFNRILRHENNLNILRSIAGIEIVSPIRDLMASSSTANQYQSTEQSWYSFFGYIFEFLTTHEVQRGTTAYNVASLEDWGQINKPQGLTIDTNNFGEFAKRFPGISVSGLTPTPAKLKELNEIVDIALRSPVQYECNGETMIMKGNFVRSADIQPSKCSQAVKRIDVYVISTFYADEDLNLKGIEELKVYAPTWSVQRAATFSLNGIDGASQKPPSNKGSPGRPGNVGLNAGNFFGFANEVINGELLTVTLNGGTGGIGQGGTDSDDVSVQFTGFKWSGSEWFGGSFDESISSLLKDRQYFDFDDIGGDIYLLHSRCCGATGKGGKGGLGGHQGLYSFVKADNDASHLPKSIANIGNNGQNGPTARVCKTNAAKIMVDSDTSNNIFKRKRKIHFSFIKHVPESKCPDNIVESHAQMSQPNPRIHLNIALGIIEYKTVLFENMNKPAFQNVLQRAYDAIESNPELNAAYSMGAFAKEANALEKLFYKLNEHIDMFPWYQNLLKRIESYSNANEATMSEVDRKVLRLLYSTVFGKAASIRSGHRSDLIVDVDGFLELTMRNIDKLDENGRRTVINAHRDKYKGEILEKINEAKGYIDNDIQPEIEHLFENLNVEMYRTINETIELQAKTIKELQRKQELQKEMRGKSFLQQTVGFISGVVGLASKFLSVGSQVAGFINSASKFVDDQLSTPQVDTSGFLFRFKQNNADKVDAMESVLGKLKDALSNRNSGAEIDDNLNGLISKVSQLKSKPSSHIEVGGVLRDALSFVQKPLKDLKDISDDILKPLERASNALSVIASSIEMFKKFSNNDAKLEALGKAIDQDRETLKALWAFEDSIYAKLIPMLDKMQLNLDEVENTFKNKSLAALDLQKWQLAPTFRAIQREFEEVLNGFGSQYQVQNYLQRVHESINLIINIYDRIQNYHEHTRFAIYLSELHSADYRDLNVDGQTREDINQLQFNLHANVLLSLYERAVDAFKQAVYPFAAEYLDIYQLPSTLLPNKNESMESIIGSTVDNIKSLSDRIKELNNTVINENDMSIYNAYFDRDGNANDPFYVWSNDQVREKVGQLFDGHKIYLLADVKESSHLNAVKLRTIRLGFRSNNETIDERLNEILQSFHVSLTHMGESNYRCNNQFFTIHSRPLSLEFSFESGRQTPAVRNVAYDKLSVCNPILSPYTLWAMQLSHGQFDRLTELRDSDVDIELYGHGQYVKQDANVCNSNLGKYYSLQNAH